jgi:ABC-2 type transport system ATP-binding protein
VQQFKEDQVIIISITDLRKAFRSRRGNGKSETVEAVRGISLDVRQGEIFGFLGPNGAGKSTTLRILSTLLAPDAGTLTIAGHDVRTRPREVRRVIGYVSQAGGTDPLATGIENLLLQARLYGLSRFDARRRAEELVEALELEPFVGRFVKTYSGGQRRKLDIAVGMVHRPLVLFLDEPTTGLDPVSRAQLWTRIRVLRQQGTTVFLTTHYMEEADALCDRVAIIDHGLLAAQGTPDDLKHAVQGDILSLTVNHLPDASPLAAEALRDLPSVREIDARDGNLRLVVERGGETLPAVLRILESRGIGVANIALSRASLDDVFLRATGHSLRDEAVTADSGAAGAGAKE